MPKRGRQTGSPTDIRFGHIGFQQPGLKKVIRAVMPEQPSLNRMKGVETKTAASLHELAHDSEERTEILMRMQNAKFRAYSEVANCNEVSGLHDIARNVIDLQAAGSCKFER